MVLKQGASNPMRDRQFENDVKTYGTQTRKSVCYTSSVFENDVKTYGTQTTVTTLATTAGFENDVKTYAKLKRTKKCYPRLRMMYNLIS